MAKDATWVTLDAATLTPEIATRYAAYKASYAETKALRQAFEGYMSEMAELPKGKRMIFGYNFGKLSVAIVDDDRPEAKPRTGTQSLAAFLAAQQAGGFAA